MFIKSGSVLETTGFYISSSVSRSCPDVTVTTDRTLNCRELDPASTKVAKVTTFKVCIFVRPMSKKIVPSGSASRGGDVMVYAFDIN